MSTSLSDVVARACRLPADAVEFDRSAVALINKSGFREHQSDITVGDIGEYLATHPELIEAWLLWSEDKRTSSGWYFDRVSEHEWIVGYLDRAGRSQTTYTNGTEACANFVLSELRSIAETGEILSSPLSVLRAAFGRLRSR